MKLLDSCLRAVPLATLGVALLHPSPCSAETASANPLLQKWETPFGVPPFPSIKDDHFLPAYEAAIAAQRAEIDAIKNNPAPADFANTIEALDQVGALLDQVEGVFNNLNSAETNDRLQAVAKKVAPMQAALSDDIRLSETLFARVKAVWDRRAELKLNPVQSKLLEETWKSFVRGGANLTAEQKKRFRAINQELSVLGVQFAENMLKATNAYQLTIDRKEDLAGLPERVVQAAAETARKAGKEGKWVFTLHWPSLWPFLEAADNRELRKEILNAYATRATKEPHNNLPIISKLVALRAERAQLLGYATHADFILEERMAKKPAQVYGLLDQLWKPALSVARKEADAMQELINAEGKRFKLEPADWRYYAEKVKQARYALDDDALRPYFPLERVRDGAFELCRRLYGITFTPRPDLPVYHTEVQAWEVKDKDGAHLGIFYGDYHPRPGKRSGAWSSRFRSQRYENGKDIRPVVVNVCNFSRPTGGNPALLSLDEVETLFHELGHGLHSLFAKIPYQRLSGVPRDFVELPSQIMEHWVLEPDFLKVYAHHWKTGETIPDTLIAKIRAARKFNQGFATVEYLAASLLDLSWHTQTSAPTLAPEEFEKATLAKIGLMPEILPRYRSQYFSHIFGSGMGGYSAGYYSYIWSEVLDSDAFEAFKERGLYDRTTAESFRREVLERGGTRDAMEMYKSFRGREPRVEPLLANRGLDAPEATQEKASSAGAPVKLETKKRL